MKSSRSLTDGGYVRRVEFVVRKSAQQTCFSNPGISEEQESEEHVVLLGHRVVDVVFKLLRIPSQLT